MTLWKLDLIQMMMIYDDDEVSILNFFLVLFSDIQMRNIKNIFNKH